MAAAHLSRHFPDFELLHVFDPASPPIGVGEGTTAGGRVWLEELAPGSFASCRRDCAATPKRGVQFENWGAGSDSDWYDFFSVAKNEPRRS
jgi:tryptophan halogenase